MRFKLFDLGEIDYLSAWALQKEVLLKVRDREFDAALLICQHHPVITLGRRVVKSHLLVSSDELKLKGIDLLEVDRGGDITYHGPGQLTAYPIFNLADFNRDLHFFLRQLESAVIGCLKVFRSSAESKPGLTGVWCNDQKICSIGIAVRQWISFHGLSLNIKASDLSGFELIKPCGMEIKMTSLETVTKRTVEIDEVKAELARSLREIIK